MEFIVLKDSAIDGSFVRTGEIVTLEQEKAEAYEKALMIEPLNKPELSSTKSDTSLVQDPTDGADPKDELGSSAKSDKKNKQK
nr:MAG TPA: hypothetical protein [Caudoviricetes sp.]